MDQPHEAGGDGDNQEMETNRRWSLFRDPPAPTGLVSPCWGWICSPLGFLALLRARLGPEGFSNVGQSGEAEGEKLQSPNRARGGEGRSQMAPAGTVWHHPSSSQSGPLAQNPPGEALGDAHTSLTPQEPRNPRNFRVCCCKFKVSAQSSRWDGDAAKLLEFPRSLKPHCPGFQVIPESAGTFREE